MIFDELYFIIVDDYIICVVKFEVFMINNDGFVVDFYSLVVDIDLGIGCIV